MWSHWHLRLLSRKYCLRYDTNTNVIRREPQVSDSSPVVSKDKPTEPAGATWGKSQSQKAGQDCRNFVKRLSLH